jgi:ubiquitin carboxyl-terminal hydrolase 5/13
MSAMDAVRDAMKSARTPGVRDLVHKDECTFSFDTPESPGGLYTSLTTWRSFGRDYVSAEFARSGHPLFLKQVFRRVAKPANCDPEMSDASAAPATPEKLAIGVAGGFDVDTPKFDVVKKYSLVVMPDVDVEIPAVGNDELPMAVAAAIDAMIAHEGAARATAVAAAWEEEDRKVSRYADDLPMVENGKKISPDARQWKCEDSGLTENLWLNLSTGHIGSGRKSWDGSGGTGAALSHYEVTGRKYPLAVKLGTITPHGADVYSYAPDEDEMVLDPKLAEHLARWGINMQQQEKTEKTMAELQIDLNASYEFDKLTESGADLVKLAGPCYVGLDNLGNSCYMNSVLQLMFAMPEFRERYVDTAATVVSSAPEDPLDDLITMTTKVGVGLCTGRYVRPVKTYPSIEEAEAAASCTLGKGSDPEPSSVRPLAFKSLIGKGHPEFSTARQQDASEFFQHMLEAVSRAERTGAHRIDGGAAREFVPTSALFGFEVEDRILCDQSGKVRYTTRSENMLSLAIPVEAATNKQLVDEYEVRKQKKQKLQGKAPEDEPVKLHVPFQACVEQFAAPEVVTDFLSSATLSKGTAQKRSRLRSFPKYLMVHLRKYYLAEDWTPKKLDVSVPVPEKLDLEALRGSGMADGEEALPDEPAAPAAEPAALVPDAALVAQVVAMGFPENGAKRAAIATGNSNAEACMEWVFAHMEDADFNDPIVAEAPSAAVESGVAVDAEAISTLSAMGFTADQAAVALKATAGNVERAVDWLFSHADDMDAAIAAEKSKQEGPGGAQNGSVTSAPAAAGRDGPGVYELVGFASHMGSNTACGHYVAHIKKEGRFVLFNDDKVAVSRQPPLDLGFIYLYRRQAVCAV